MRARAIVAVTLLAMVMPSARAAGAAPIGYSIQLSATTRQVGQSLTLTPVVTGVAAGTQVRCSMQIGREIAMDNWMRMQVASDGCEPWAFPIPASAPGPLVVEGTVWVDLVGGVWQSFTTATSQVVNVTTGGSEVPWVTNYPVQSWAFKDLVSTPTPALGAPFTIKPPASADGCNIRIVADLEESSVQPVDTCSSWALTIPDREHQGPGNLFPPRRTEVTIISWTGTIPYPGYPPYANTPSVGYGETFTANLPDFAPPGNGASTTYASNLPAIFTGPERGHIGEVGSGVPFVFDPVVVGTTTGWCLLGGPASPVVPGGCTDSGLVASPLGTSNVVEHTYAALIDEQVTTTSDTYGSIGWVVPMGTLDLTVPSNADSGQSVSIDASTDAGVPAAWEITAAPSGTAAAATPIASGELPTSVASSGGQVHVDHAFGPGTWTVTATFTDVRGDTRSNSSEIAVADTVAPTGTVSVNGGAAWTTSTAVTVAVPATDADGTVTTVALSNDGTTWTNRVYAPSQSWTLPSTNGTRTVFAKWRDNGGNWSAVRSDTIGLDTAAPTSTAPANAFVAGSKVNSGLTPTRFAWSGTDATSGVARYEAAISTDGGAYATISTALTATALTRNLASGHTYRLRIRGIDVAGNTGAWAYGATFRVSRYQEASSRISYGGTWYRPSSTKYWGGRERYSRIAGARASFTFTGRAFAWVGCRGPSRGGARIYVNGVLVATVGTYATVSSCRRLLYAVSWSTAVSRTITIVVRGTSGHPRVDLDALVTSG